MKHYLLFVFLYLLTISISAQEVIRPVRLKNGILTKSGNLRNQSHLIDSLKKFNYKNRFYTLIQFNKLPDAKERQALLQDGILLYDYIPDNTYLAEVNDQIVLNRLKKSNITGLFTLHATTKISPDLVQQLQQPVRDPDKLIAVSFYGNIDKATVVAELKKAGAQIIEKGLQPSHAVFIDAPVAVIQKIAGLPFVSYISSQNFKMESLNYKNRGAHAVNTLSAIAGRNLQGKNVTVGIGDDGDPSTHVDFSGRLLNINSHPVETHSTHVTGTAAGAGIVNPKYKGMAPQASIINQFYTEILEKTPYNVTHYNMVLTNNSYGGSPDCEGGNYNLTSVFVDEQMNTYPALLHVFAAGNSGRSSCSPYPASFYTVVSGGQSAKNVLTVGNLDNSTYTIAGSSSRGPVADGRLKPEIVTGGAVITSATPYNTYGTGSGTSMAAPTATGILALFYERYKQLHGGSNPSSALMKAIACNGADDIGNPGPDFTFGFGKMNARNSVEAIENNNWFTGTIDQGGSATFTIPSVLAGTAQIKILLYWNDPAAAAGAAGALVNNLDLTVTTPDAAIHYPLVPDPSPGNVNNVAVESVDNRNNMEQVVINNPAAGNFTVTVNGTGIARGPQDYVVVYQVIQPGVTVEYPFGEETLAPGETEVLRWSAADPNTSNFTIEYSLNNGSSFTTIDNNVPATSRSYTWTIPSSIASSSALIRVSRNNTTYSDASDYNFTILDTTTITVTTPCPGYANILWSSIPAATSYDIMMLKGSSMQVIASATDTSYLLDGLNKDSTYWLAVRGVMGTVAGRRSVAQSVMPLGSTVCNLPEFYNDLSPDLLVAPVSGRMYTSSQLGAIAPQLRITNMGAIATTGSVNISYQVNGGTPVTETATISIAAHSNYTYTFASVYDFSNTGTYTVKTWIDYSSDAWHINDTLTVIVKHLQNNPIVLNSSIIEGFESATVKTYYKGTVGVDGLDRCDFYGSDSNGRARVDSFITRAGKRAITLDQKLNTGITSVNSLITTFNLSNYNSTDELFLSLYYKNEGINFVAPGNKIWIRGSDHDAWIPIYTLSSSAADFAVYRAMPEVNITETLANASPLQTVSSSLQIKIGEEGYKPGYTIDDITIRIEKFKDLSPDLLLPSVTGRMYTSSQLGAIAPQVRIKNTGNLTVSGSVNISYQVNGGPPVTETATINLATNSSYTHTFTGALDFSNCGTCAVKAWIDCSSDLLRSNDTSLTTIIKNLQNDPLILNPAYTEGFESATIQTYYNGTMGFDGLDRCDFYSSDINGRARTFVNSGVVRTGNRAITLDRKSHSSITSADSLITTFNLSNYNSTDQLLLSLYFRNEGIYFSAPGNKIWIRGSDHDAWIPIYTLPHNFSGIYLAMPAVNITQALANASPSQTVSSSFQIKFGVEGYYYGYTFDDVTIRLYIDDVGMVQLNTSGACAPGAAEPITVQVKNYSSSTLTNIPVSYRVNSMAAVTEYIPFLLSGDSVNYTFTQTADFSAFGQYTIKAWTHFSTDNYSINDTIVSTFHTSPLTVTSYPYLEGFEGANSGSWYTGGVNSSWQCGTPSGSFINKAANGSKAWVTGLNGSYNNNELSYLYSPCFDLSTLTNPVLSFSYIFKTQDNCNCDYLWAEYSTDGQTWTNLVSSWQGSMPGWQMLAIPIPVRGTSVRFRFVMQSDSSVTEEGMGIDNISIMDNVPIYIGPDVTSGLTKAVSGNNWIDITADDGSGTYAIIASVNANGQDLGNTEVKFYYNFDWDSAHNDGYQFYIDRNIVIQPTKVPTGPVKVRFYFYQFEVDNLLYVPGCDSCYRLSNAYEAGIAQYSNAPAEEDGSLNNNKSGTWNFIKPSAIIPYGYGYYAEYEVNNFSEFWITGRDPRQNQALPLQMGPFTVTKNNNTALLKWLTYTESNTERFIIERSTDGINYLVTGTLPASGNSTTIKQYRYTDEHPATGINYYRIKQTDKDDKFSYSPVRTLNFADNNFTVTVKPNPVSHGIIYVTSTSDCNRIELRDAIGRLIKTASVNGMQTQLPVHDVAPGIYFITVITDNGSKVKKLFIE
jgi:hypothetical protein